MSEKLVNGLTQEQYSDFRLRLAAAPCTREAIEALHKQFFPHIGGPRYPDEHYADKDNALAGEPTGHLRYESGRMVWVKHD